MGHRWKRGDARHGGTTIFQVLLLHTYQWCRCTRAAKLCWLVHYFVNSPNKRRHDFQTASAPIFSYCSLDNVDVNDPWRRVDRGGGQSNRLGRTIGRPSAARRMSSSSAWTGIPQSRYSGEEPRRTPSRVSPTAEAVCGSAAPATSTRGRKGKPLPLEEPYIIQPTHEASPPRWMVFGCLAELNMLGQAGFIRSPLSHIFCC